MVNEHSETFIATGNIAPCVFVKADTSDSQQCVLCGANEDAIGVSDEGMRTFDGSYAAISGDALRVHLAPGECLLTAGAAVDEGQLLKSDASGFGIPILTTGAVMQKARARARQAASGSGVKIRVVLLLDDQYPALS